MMPIKDFVIWIMPFALHTRAVLCCALESVCSCAMAEVYWKISWSGVQRVTCVESLAQVSAV